MSAQSPYVMPVGDPRRLLIRRAAFAALLASAWFLVFTATKQIKPVYVHAPWANDPYDTVFSLTMFFVPLVAAGILVPVSLCGNSQPLPMGRAVMILGGCRVAVAAMSIELLAAWAAVAAGANRSAWTAATAILTALLVLSSVVTGKSVVELARAPRLPSPRHGENSEEADWLGDLLMVARRQADRLGPLRRHALSGLGWTDRIVVSKVRRHPLGAAAVASGAFAATVFGWQAVREGYALSLTGLEIGLGFCGMFAFLVIAGSHLGIARGPTRLYGPQRRALDAGVAACIVAVAVLAFRDWLWWIVGSHASVAGPAQFAALLGITITCASVLVFAVETSRGSHTP